MNSNLDSAVDSAAEDPAAARGAADSAAGTPSAAPRRPRFGLLPRILVAIVLAIGLGLVMPESIARDRKSVV